ncbi:MAG: YceI family protein [Actinobacteria bacterium]|nr:YceI family protein [Actinomycetota bacterium]
MTPKSGTHDIGPSNGQLTVNTYVGGMGSKMGHDLVLQASRWSGTLNLDPDNPSASSVQVTIDPRSLEVIQASGGVKALSDKDKREIAQNQEKTLQVDRFPEITFESTSVNGSAPRLSVDGNLTIVGNTRPVTLDVEVDDAGANSKVTAKTTIVQTDFGVKPYSKLGALKVKDPVDLQIVLTLPSA